MNRDRIAIDIFKTYSSINAISARVIDILYQLRQSEDDMVIEEESLIMEKMISCRDLVTVENVLSLSHIRYHYPILYKKASISMGDIVASQIMMDARSIAQSIEESIGNDTLYYVRYGHRVRMVTIPYDIDMAHILCQQMYAIGDMLNGSTLTLDLIYCYLCAELEVKLGIREVNTISLTVTMNLNTLIERISSTIM